MSSVANALPALLTQAMQTGIGIIVQATLILLCTFLASRMLRSSGPQMQRYVYQAAVAAIGGCILTTVALSGRTPALRSLALPSASEGVSSEIARTTGTGTREATATAPAVVADSSRHLNRSSVTAETSQTVQTIPRGAKSVHQSTPSYAPPFQGYLSQSFLSRLTPAGWFYLAIISAWLVGAASHLLWLIFCYIGIARIRARSILVRDTDLLTRLRALCIEEKVGIPEVRISAEVQSVYLVGFLRPAILVPSNGHSKFDTAALHAAFAHEVAHLAGRDIWWNLAVRVVCAVGWIHPLLWRLRDRWDQSCEEVCDQAVLARDISPQLYARCLLSFAEGIAGQDRRLQAANGMVVFRSSLGQRVQKILQGQMRGIPRIRPAARVAILGATTAFALLLGLFTASLASVEDSWATDSRLSQIVAVRAEGLPIRELLPLLSEKTGVRLVADSFVTDDKVILLGPPRPLRDLLSDVAALFDDGWIVEQTGKEAPSYRLSRSQRARRYEQRLAEEMDNRVLGQLDDQVKALKESPEQFARRSPGDPARQMLSTADGRLATDVFALLPPEKRRQLIDQWYVRLPVSALSADQKKQLEPLFFGDKFKPDPNDPNGLTPTPVPREEMDKRDITFDILGNRLTGQLHVSLRAPTGFDLPLADVHTNARLPLPPHGNPYTGAKVTDLREVPTADDIRAAQGQGWIEKLRALADKTGKPIVSDFFRSKSMQFATAGEEPVPAHPGEAALDTLCQEPGYLWWIRGKTLMLRKRDWYYQQLYEVPDWWTQTLARRVKEQKGIVTNGDVLSLLDLTTNQIVGLSESSGGHSDRRILAGLRGTFAVIAASPVDKKAPLYSGQFASPESRRATVKPDLNDPRMNAFFREFLTEYFPDLLNKPDLSVVGLLVYPARPYTPGSDSITIGTVFPYGDGVRAGYLFNLPLVVPEDHRDRTEVRVVQAGNRAKPAAEGPP